MANESDLLKSPASRVILLVFNIVLVLTCVGSLAYRIMKGESIEETGLILILALGLFLNHLVFQYGKGNSAFNIVAYAYTAFMAVAIIWTVMNF